LKRKRNGKRAKRKSGKKKNGKVNNINFHFLYALIVLVFQPFLGSLLRFIFITHPFDFTVEPK
jgi:hypothetical protein